MSRKSLHVKIPGELYEWLNDYSDKKDLTKTNIVIEALKRTKAISNDEMLALDEEGIDNVYKNAVENNFWRLLTETSPKVEEEAELFLNVLRKNKDKVNEILSED